MRFDGKVALITGAARGIGREIAETIAREGGQVIIADVNLDQAQETAGALQTRGLKADAIRLDVSDIPGAGKVVKGIFDKYHRLDILVNNAGICPTTPVEEIPEEEWDRVLAVNLKGAFFMCQAVIPIMKQQHYGKIVNISSIAGKMGALVAGCHYTASKAGILGITKVLARYLASFGINVNAVAPGTVESQMTAGWSDEEKEMLKTKIPMGRLGQPQDIATAVAFLASDESCFITGETLDVNGGALMD